MIDYTYTLLIPLIPLVFLFTGLAGHKMKPLTSGLIGTTGLFAVTILSYLTAIRYFWTDHVEGAGYSSLKAFEIQWLHLTDKLTINLGVLLDPISVMMLIVVSTVSFMVHIYSLGYMKVTPRICTFLFIFVALYFRHAWPGARHQYFPEVHFLGARGCFILPADRILL